MEREDRPAKAHPRAVVTVSAIARDGRGVLPVLGLLVLIGMVAVTTIGLLVVGADQLTDRESDAELERAVQAFGQVGHDATTVALSSDESRMTNLGMAGSQLDSESGSITVELSGYDEPVLERDLGALHHQEGDARLAYEGGGVWVDSGTETQPVSAPGIGYADGSFSLPVIDVVGSDGDRGSELRFSAGDRESVHTGGTAVDGKMALITVESEFYRGWAAHFEQTVGSDHVTVDASAERVTAFVGYPHLDGDFSQAATVLGDFQSVSPNSCIDGEVTITGSVEDDDCRSHDHGTGGDELTLRPIDEAVTYVVETAARDGEHIDGKTTDTIDEPGIYYVDGNLTRTDDLTVDLSSGNVTLAVDGHVRLDDAGIHIEGGVGSASALQVYTTGDVAIGRQDGGISMNGPDTAERFQLYGTSEMHFGFGQGEFIGTVYAPRNEPASGTNEAAEGHISSANNCDEIDGEEPDVCIGTGIDLFKGSITAGSMSIEQNTEFTYDDSLDGVEPSLPETSLPPALEYFDAAVYDVYVHGE